MIMDEVFKELRALQDVLSEKIELEREIQDIPKLLTTQEELLSRLKKTFIDKNVEFEATRERINLLRGQLADAETNREKAEKAMDSISTQREYEALDKEIRDASDKEQQYRKDLQKEERVFAEMDEQQKKDAELIEHQEAELKEKRSGVETEIAARKDELVKLSAQEKEITPSLDPDILFKFERIIRSKLGLGIVAIKGGVCTGCHMILPSQFANSVRTGEQIIFCPYCSRILYYQEAEQGEQDFFDDGDSGSLSDLDDVDGEDDEDYDDDGDGDDGDEKNDMGFDD